MGILDFAPRRYLSIPLASPKYRIWDMPPTRQYLPIRPFSRRYRIWDIAPLQRRNIDLLSVSVFPSSSAVAGIGCGILPHISIYLSPFPARNIGYGICPLRVSIYLSAPSAADIRYGNIGYCPTSVSTSPPFQPEIQDMGYAPYASVSTYSPLQPQI